MGLATFEDAFNLLCGDKLGEGIHRNVFECRLRDDLVVKVEKEDAWRFFANVHEMKFWSDYQDNSAIAKWLAPCDYLSPDGRILLQKRVRMVQPMDAVPDALPQFLTDIKRGNFGWIGEQLVAVDYAITDTNASVRMKKAVWA